jgi:hypothetical protein
MWDGTGDLATAAALDRIEEELGLGKRSDAEWQELASHLLGEVVKKIAAELEKGNPRGEAAQVQQPLQHPHSRRGNSY